MLPFQPFHAHFLQGKSQRFRHHFQKTSRSGSMSVNESSNNTFTQWGVQAINNAYQRTANAIAKNIKKNKAKLKYGTFVYLVNSQDKKN